MSAPFANFPVEFVGSFPDPLTRLDPPLPEIAFLGRSNVGKSSLLNALVGRKGLARVSATPGKTTLLNAFRLPDRFLIDLPGYGFARASKSDRAAYGSLLSRCLQERSTLSGVVWLLDIRHDPSTDDLAMQDLLIGTARPVLAVLTKADKLGRGAHSERARAIGSVLGLPDDQVLVTSARTGAGVAELGAAILGLGRSPGAAVT